MSFWMSTANSLAGAARGFWTAEIHRQQSAMADEIVRRTVDLWTRTWIAPIAGYKPKRRR
jgi:hypothetical protein